MDEIKTLEQLHEHLERRNMEGFWRVAAGILTKEPTNTGEPYLWKRDDIYTLITKAGNLVDPTVEGERRGIMLVNPMWREFLGTTNTMNVGIQLYKHGDVARAHRHAMEASRFAIKGSGAFTTVGGEKFIMEEGDLVITPGLEWHDHGNDGYEEVMSFDVVMAPLCGMLMRSLFFTPYHQDRQEVIHPEGHIEAVFGKGGIRPENISFQKNSVPPMIYRWHDVYAQLLRREEYPSDPFDGLILQYVNPTGRASTTITCNFRIQLLKSRDHTRAHQHVSSTVYYVIRGKGVSTVNGKELSWDRGDCFVVPLWAVHKHENKGNEDAILFSASDDPIFKALGMYQERAVAPNN